MLFLIALLLMNLQVLSQRSYVLKIQPVDKMPDFLQNTFNPDTLFAGQTECQIYVSNFLASLQAKGYITASVDSVMYDSLSAKMVLFVGELYKWSSVNVDEPARQWLMKMNLAGNLFDNQRVDFEKVDILQQRMFHFFENNGYPFARIWLDSMNIDNNLVSGKLKIDPGPLYRIDSIQVSGNAKISSDYLKNFLDIKNNSVYNKEKLAGISDELKKLNYIEE
ncbi:MAG TPA: POTRA domain-containing protein, partial [Niabella sp.]|nr:POTRA domain-containing protein [Niabella sp.]